MNIIQDFIPVGRRNRPGTKLTGPKYITIHDTANPSKGANALMHARYLKGDDAANRPASWHFTVDDTYIVQHLPLDEVGWHAGDGSSGPGNRSSVAIEICENVDGDRAKAEENAAKLVAHLLKQFNLPINAVVQHNRWSGKNCPHIIRARKDGWENFLRMVSANMEDDKPMTQEERDALDALLWRVTALEKKIPAPAWFVKEFGSADLDGLIHDPQFTEEGWRTLAVALRAMGKGKGAKG